MITLDKVDFIDKLKVKRKQFLIYNSDTGKLVKSGSSDAGFGYEDSDWLCAYGTGICDGGVIRKKGKEHNAAILNFKSNAPTRDLYNITAIMNLEGRELRLNYSDALFFALHISSCIRMVFKESPSCVKMAARTAISSFVQELETAQAIEET